MPVLCLVCKKIFSSLSSLNRHRKEVHNLNSSYVTHDVQESKYKNSICGEQDCNSSFINVKTLREHLSDVHQIETRSVQEIDFSSLEEFENWFMKEKKKIGTKFYLLTTLKSKNGEKTSYFYCNRSGKIKQKEESLRKRKVKKHGSFKMNKYCTSQIILKRNLENGTCSVQYFYQHYGHDIQKQHIRIDECDKEMIDSEKKSEGSVSQIIDNVRDEVGTDKNLKRVDPLVKKNKCNITSVINISDACRNKIFIDLEEEIETLAKNIKFKIKTESYSYDQLKIILKYISMANSVVSRGDAEFSKEKFKVGENATTEPSENNIKKHIIFKNRNEKANHNENEAVKVIFNDHMY